MEMSSTEMIQLEWMSALIELMKRKPYRKIKIEEIAEEGHLLCATYFRYFSSKDQILLFYLDRKMRQFKIEHPAKRSMNEDGYFHFVYELFHILVSMKEFALLLIKNDKFHLIRKHFEHSAQ